MNKVKPKEDHFWSFRVQRGESARWRYHPWWVEMLIEIDGGMKLVTKYKTLRGARSAATKLKKVDCRVPFTVTVTRMGKEIC